MVHWCAVSSLAVVFDSLSDAVDKTYELVKNKEYQDVNLDTWCLYAKRASCSAVNPLRFNLSLYRRFIFPLF